MEGLLNYMKNFIHTLHPNRGIPGVSLCPLPFSSLFLFPQDDREHGFLKGPLPFLLKTPFDSLDPRAHDQNVQLLWNVLKNGGGRSSWPVCQIVAHLPMVVIGRYSQMTASLAVRMNRLGNSQVFFASDELGSFLCPILCCMFFPSPPIGLGASGSLAKCLFWDAFLSS